MMDFGFELVQHFQPNGGCPPICDYCQLNDCIIGVQSIVWDLEKKVRTLEEFNSITNAKLYDHIYNLKRDENINKFEQNAWYKLRQIKSLTEEAIDSIGDSIDKIKAMAVRRSN
jgi:hypothetical protein